jgi:hypothetical protein
MRSRRLPLHPQPLPDEALSSWLLRLSAAYRLTAKRFIEAALGQPAPIGGLGALDESAPDDLVRALSVRTGVPPERVRTMTLAGYGVLLSDAGPSAFKDYVGQYGCLAPTTTLGAAPRAWPGPFWRPWISGDLLDNRPRSCGRCLAADPVPYTRIYWRAGWMASCPIHAELLAPIRVEIAAEVSARTPPRPAGAELVALDRLTQEAVKAGMVQLPSGEDIHAGVWLRALRTLVDELIRPLGHLQRGGHARVAAAWRVAGRGLHEGRSRSLYYEAMMPEQRELALMVASHAVGALFAGELTPLGENAASLFRPQATSKTSADGGKHLIST